MTPTEEDTGWKMPTSLDISKKMKQLERHHQTINAILAFMVLKKYSDTDTDCFIDWKEFESAPSGISDLLSMKIRHIEDVHPELLGWFEGLDLSQAFVFNDEARDYIWKDIIRTYSGMRLRFSDARQRVIGQLFERLSSTYESDETPEFIIELETEIINPRNGASVYDPFCSSGRSLAVVSQTVTKKSPRAKIKLFAQTFSERNTLAIRLNFLLTDNYDGKAVFGDVIKDPGFVEENQKLTTFQGIIGVLPIRRLRTDKDQKHGAWSTAQNDPFSRFIYGIPPVSRGDFLFLQHCIASLAPDGMMALLVPPSILFTERSEGIIRKGIIQDDLIEAVISLPEKIVDYSSISFAILVVNRNKAPDRKNKILFIDGTNDFTPGKPRNVLCPEHIQKIVGAFRSYSDQDGYAKACSLDEIENNGPA